MDSPRVITTLDNEFGQFTVEELVYDNRRARVLFAGPLHAAQSGIPLDNNPHMLFDYNQLLLELTAEINPDSLLILGGGVLTLPTAITNTLVRTKVTVVEINVGLIELARQYFGYRQNARLKVIVDDAGRFMLNQRLKYDLIITDVFDNFTLPLKFRSRQFAAALAGALNTGGLVATNCISFISSDQNSPLGQIKASYAKAIGPTKIIKVDPSYPKEVSQNLIVVSGDKSSQVLKHKVSINLF